jgi:hypothetical protein
MCYSPKEIVYHFILQNVDLAMPTEYLSFG